MLQNSGQIYCYESETAPKSIILHEINLNYAWFKHAMKTV